MLQTGSSKTSTGHTLCSSAVHGTRIKASILIYVHYTQKTCFSDYWTLRSFTCRVTFGFTAGLARVRRLLCISCQFSIKNTSLELSLQAQAFQ